MLHIIMGVSKSDKVAIYFITSCYCTCTNGTKGQGSLGFL